MSKAGRKPLYDYDSIKSGDVINIPFEKRNSFSQCLRAKNFMFETKKHDSNTVNVFITGVFSNLEKEQRKKTWLNESFIINNDIPIPEKKTYLSNDDEFYFLIAMKEGESFLTGSGTLNTIRKNAKKRGVNIISQKVNKTLIRIWKTK